jgi:hypothetical protein
MLIPAGKEKKRWDKLIKGEIDFFASSTSDSIRAFRRVKTENGVIILLIDTSRREDYQRSMSSK